MNACSSSSRISGMERDTDLSFAQLKWGDRVRSDGI